MEYTATASTLAEYTTSNLQSANLLCAQADSASYPHWNE